MKRFSRAPTVVILTSMLLNPAHAQDELPLTGPAYVITEEAFRAFERGDVDRAIERAREAARLRPDVARIRALLDKALAVKRGGQSKAQHAPVQSGNDNGYRHAAAAYRNYDNGNFQEAVSSAEKAVRAAPDNRAYRLLLITSLLAAHRGDEAQRVLAAAMQRFPNNRELLEKQNELRRERVYRLQERMYAALARGDQAGAITAAQNALALTPEDSKTRLILAHTLLMANRPEAAQSALTEAMQRNGATVTALALRGVAYQLQGASAAAEKDFAQALARSEQSASEREIIILASVDAALASGQIALAQAWLAPVQGSESKDIVQRRNLLQNMLRGGPPSRIDTPPSIPALECAGDGGETCTLRAGASPKDPAFDVASEAYAAFERKNYAEAARKARAAIAISLGNDAYRQLLFNALLASEQYQDAEQAATDTMQAYGPSGPLLAERGHLRLRLQKPLEAKQDFAGALKEGGLSPAQEIGVLSELDRKEEAKARLRSSFANGELKSMSDVDVGYLASRAGDPDTANAAFGQADRSGILPDHALQDAAFAALHLSHDEQSVDYLKRSIDAANALKLRMDPGTLFNARRAVAEIGRQYGLLASVRYGSGGSASTAGLLPASSSNNAAQFGAEAYWRPFGFQDGRLVEVYGRVFQTLYSEAGDPTGAASLQGAIGARWKPWSTQNVVFSVNRLLKLGVNAQEDWLLQGAYSTGTGTDLAVNASNWFTAQLYAEGGRYLKSGQTYATAGVQAGRSYRLEGVDPNLVLFPHVSMATDYNSDYARKGALGIGPGVSVRYWYRGDVYAAPRSYIEFVLQQRVRIAGDDRARGLFFSTSVSY